MHGKYGPFGAAQYGLLGGDMVAQSVCRVASTARGKFGLPVAEPSVHVGCGAHSEGVLWALRTVSMQLCVVVPESASMRQGGLLPGAGGGAVIAALFGKFCQMAPGTGSQWRMAHLLGGLRQQLLGFAP